MGNEVIVHEFRTLEPIGELRSKIRAGVAHLQCLMYEVDYISNRVEWRVVELAQKRHYNIPRSVFFVQGEYIQDGNAVILGISRVIEAVEVFSDLDFDCIDTRAYSLDHNG